MSPEQLLAKLEGVRKSGETSWMARCPAHKDSNPSLSISVGRNRDLLLHCHTGCATEAVMAALGLTLKDLFDNPREPTGARKITATYDYTDENGHLLFQTVRFEPKDFRQRHGDGNGGWLWNLNGVRRVLFHLPQLLAAKAKTPILVVEGEKDALCAESHGFTATTAPMGAKAKWLEEYTAALAGADVFVIPDNDPPGRAHAAEVATALLPQARSVRLAPLPELIGVRPVKDLSDYFAAGGSPAQLTALLEESKPFVLEDCAAEPDLPPTTEEPPPGDWHGVDVNEPVPSQLPPIRNAQELIEDQTIIYPLELVDGVLHQGTKAVLGSGSKARKTWSLIDLSISIANGMAFWKWPTRQGRVLYLNFEIPEAFLRTRIATVAAAKKAPDCRNLDEWTLRGHAAPLWRLLPEIERRIANTPYRLIAIDPIYKGLGDRDENATGDIAALCNEVESLAVHSGAAVVFAAHFSKGNQAGKEAIDRISGSGVWARDPDSIITLTKHAEEDAYTVDLCLRNFPEQQSFVVKWTFPLFQPESSLDMIDQRITTLVEEGTTKDLKELIEAQTRLSEQERVLDGRPAPGQLRPTAQRSAPRPVGGLAPRAAEPPTEGQNGTPNGPAT